MCLVGGGAGVPGLGGCLLPGGRQVWWGGVPGPGVCLVWGGLLPGGSGIPACTEADPPPWTESQTLVKTLPWPNFVAAGNNVYSRHANCYKRFSQNTNL